MNRISFSLLLLLTSTQAPAHAMDARGAEGVRRLCKSFYGKSANDSYRKTLKACNKETDSDSRVSCFQRAAECIGTGNADLKGDEEPKDRAQACNQGSSSDQAECLKRVFSDLDRESAAAKSNPGH